MSEKQVETREWVEKEGEPDVVYVDPNSSAYIRSKAEGVGSESRLSFSADSKVSR